MRLFLFIGVPLLAPFMRSSSVRSSGKKDRMISGNFNFVFALESDGYPNIGDIPSTLSLTTETLGAMFLPTFCTFVDNNKHMPMVISRLDSAFPIAM